MRNLDIRVKSGNMIYGFFRGLNKNTLGLPAFIAFAKSAKDSVRYSLGAVTNKSEGGMEMIVILSTK